MRAYSNDACTWTNVERRFSSVKEGGRGGWPGGSSNNGHGPSIDTSRLRSVMNAKQTRFSPLPLPLRSLFFPFFFFLFSCHKRMKSILCQLRTKEEGRGGFLTISYSAGFAIKNHRIMESVDSQEFFIGKNAPRTRFPTGREFFFSTAKIL